MTHREMFAALLQAASMIQPYRAPDFANDIVCTYWFKEFGSIDFAIFRAAMDRCMQTLSFFPSIVDVRKELGVHDKDPDLEARQIVAAIISAIRNYGWNRELEAKRNLDVVAWKVVMGVGGWALLCDMTTDNAGSISAQMRELARSFLIANRFPNNDQNKAALQSAARQAIDIVTHATRDLDANPLKKLSPKGVGDPARHTRLSRGI